MILTTGKIVFVTDPDESDCYIENLRMSTTQIFYNSIYNRLLLNIL